MPRESRVAEFRYILRTQPRSNFLPCVCFDLLYFFRRLVAKHGRRSPSGRPAIDYPFILFLNGFEFRPIKIRNRRANRATGATRHWIWGLAYRAEYSRLLHRVLDFPFILSLNGCEFRRIKIKNRRANRATGATRHWIWGPEYRAEYSRLLHRALLWLGAKHPSAVAA